MKSKNSQMHWMVMEVRMMIAFVGRVLTRKGLEGNFFGDRNVLYLKVDQS